MAIKHTQRLDVYRTLEKGNRVPVGTLAQNSKGVFFQYQPDYLAHWGNLSPFNLQHNTQLQHAPMQPHHRLHGVFADSLPDGWGLLLMDRVFRKTSIVPSQITALDRLAFVGAGGMGALSYEPVSELALENAEESLSIAELGLEAQAFFDGQTEDVLAALIAAGSSGGARPKAQLYLQPGLDDVCSTRALANSKAYLVKFTSSRLALGHEEGPCEAVYLTLAKKAGIDVPNWRLLDAPQQSGAKKWLALERFDTIYNGDNPEGRYHLHSACGLLDADFRMPSLDYEDLIKASSMLCNSPKAGQQQFKRALFNLFACNQDDHSKNWAFLQSDSGDWRLSPFYDVTFSPSPYGEHATVFAGYGKQPPLKVIQQLARHANYDSSAQIRQVIAEVIDSLNYFTIVARELGVSKDTCKLISQQLNKIYQENKGLLTI